MGRPSAATRPASRPACPPGSARPGSAVLPPLRREVRDEELGQFCARASALLRTEEPGPEAVDALRRLFLFVAATKYGRK